MSQSELACVYAALILYDDGLDITVSRSGLCLAVVQLLLVGGTMEGCRQGSDDIPALFNSLDAGATLPVLNFPHILPMQADNINTVVKAAGVTVEPYWPTLFAKLCQTKSIGDFITNVGAGGGAAAAPVAGGAGPAAAAAAEEKEEEKEEEEVSDGPWGVDGMRASGYGVWTYWIWAGASDGVASPPMLSHTALCPPAFRRMPTWASPSSTERATAAHSTHLFYNVVAPSSDL
jgi:large subunit ribosomal protein LP1